MRIGSLFSGYGGLDMAVASVFGATTAWVSDIDKGACKILAHRYPDVPNLGDVSVVDWSTVQPVDIITGGYPCQPFSHAGRRQGTDDDRHLWPYVREAVRHLRPRVTVLENVAGHRSMGFDRVLGDLAEDGLDVRWASLRAADVGAPHGRERLFIVVTQPEGDGRDEGWAEPAGLVGRPDVAISGDESLTLLPTPAVNDMGAGKTVEAWDEWTAKMQAAHANGNGHGKSLAIEAARLLPTPTQRDYKDNVIRREPHRPDDTDTLSRALAGPLLPTPTAQAAKHSADDRGPGTEDDSNLWSVAARGASFGQYAAAVARWEQVLGRPAPAPTEPTGRNDAHRLSPRFVEWMMGLPDGWVTDVPGITRNEALKALGNGVVPQQAEAALRLMLSTAVAA